MAGIVVGVDGSDNSRRALHWAVEEARYRQLPLTALAVRPEPARPATRIYGAVPRYPDNSLDPELTRMALAEFVAKVRAEAAGQAPDVSIVVTNGDVVEELVKASRDADLMVVGSRGGGGVTRFLVGSVSGQVAHHSACPVVVVPGAGK